MNNNDISTLVDPPDHLLRVKCRARFPREHIINFAFASVGRFTLVLDSDRKILRANARLHDATYKYLVVDDPQILEAFAEGRDSEQYLSFPPLTKFRLDPFDEPDSNDSDASRPETARLVDVSNLPIMVVFGRRPIASLEPPKGAVNARLEAIWGKDVGHPISGLKKAEIYHKPLIDTAPVRRPVYRRVASPPDAMSRSSNRGLTILTLYAEQSSPLESECVAEIGRDTSRDTVPACEPGLGCSVPGHQCRDRNNYTTCKLHRRLVTLHQQMEKGGYQMLPSDSEAAGAGEKISTKRNNTSMEPRSTSGAFALATLEGLAAASNALREVGARCESVADAQSDKT
ncbi:uncharacterized protein EKO05_0006111 [Ascochyta rabiei]|uniref:uncharacterized protein n=1 Tax=Didymella rabiei TaxID=5454 RepID=UPI00220A6CC0|nr:uncharacterized protein EKO05_0006111 [Ascochyta rabiei]UPX15670.1 hypothetical protein EKO05_0006111 [Ascochyta rabiei]